MARTTTSMVGTLLDHPILYRLSLQPALNNVLLAYSKHEGTFGEFVGSLKWGDLAPLVQFGIFVLSIGLGLVTLVGAGSSKEKKKGPVANKLAGKANTELNALGGVLDPNIWKSFTLIDKSHLSHNTALYKFRVPVTTDIATAAGKVVHGQEPRLGLPIGQHISVRAEINGKQVMRSYTPTTLDGEVPGEFHLVVKTYEKGNISRYLSLLTVGQDIQVKGPKGKFHYTRDLSHHLLMLAGGTGITPMYQIIKASLKDPKDTTQLRLIYANVNEDDILLRDELNNLEKQSNGRLQILYVLNNPPAGWNGGSGFITKEMIEKHMPEEGVGKPTGGSKVLLCGPPPMINAMKGHLSSIGYPPPNTISKLEDQVFCF